MICKLNVTAAEGPMRLLVHPNRDSVDLAALFEVLLYLFDRRFEIHILDEDRPEKHLFIQWQLRRRYIFTFLSSSRVVRAG